VGDVAVNRNREARRPVWPLAGGEPGHSPGRPKIPFSLPDISDLEIAAVTECLRSGWLTSGPRCAAFEKDFAEFLGGDTDAVSVSSGTAALEIALAALGIGAGDEVITSDFTFSATAMSIVHVGAKPVLIDIDAGTLNMDCDRIERAITPRTKAILPVHYGGLACNMDSIRDIASRHDLRIVEDAAHALPTTWKKRLVGNGTSDATAFSFYATKTITTGEGGMICFTDPDLARKARILRLHGIDRDVFARYGASRGGWNYEIVAPGMKANLSDIAAALGIEQLKRAWKFHQQRARISDLYDRSFARLPLVLPPKALQGDIHSHHLYPIRLRDDAPIGRDDFILRMADLGVSCSVHFIPLHLHSYWHDTLGLSENMFPESQEAFEKIVTLPLFTSMTDNMQQYVVDSVQEVLS
jgi:dTDP-4-amino-4,6-dideoxygalactose transaminase